MPNDPFRGPPPKEVPLPRAPLARVLTQLRFPPIWAIADPATIVPFQEQIRGAYPLSDREVVQRIDLGSESQAAVRPEAVWRFQDRDKAWRVSLGPAFLALETLKYTSRQDFLARADSLIEALSKTINPQLVTRVGLRYLDRLDATALERISDLVRPEVIGSYSLFKAAIRHILANAEFATAEGATINARWGMLPSGATYEPSILEPIEDKSWVIDLDMYIEAQADFTNAVLTPQLESFAKRIYAVFRYMVTKQFLAYYEGKP
jgi:uncharacterized protein (TIGR04255 family)